MNGQKLRKWREELGLTQVELAALLEVSRRSIIDWESGATDIPEAIAFQTMKRGSYGPVQLHWHTSPVVQGPAHRTTMIQVERFDTVDGAVDRACELLRTKKAFLTNIYDDESHASLWDYPSLRREVIRRKHAEKSTNPGRRANSA